MSDADTVRARDALGSERIRPAGFDAPEVADPGRPATDGRDRPAMRRPARRHEDGPRERVPVMVEVERALEH